MNILEQLTSGGLPPNTSTSGISSQTMPSWYMDYLRGMSARATDIAGTPYAGYPGQRVAPFTGDQNMAFQNVRENQGAWMPFTQSAYGALQQVMPGMGQQLNAANQYGSGAVGAAGGNAMMWPQNFQQYMSPYTQSVVDEIGRLGNRNLMENIVPDTTSAFVGSGQFGSTRNADIMGRAIRDAQRDISGQQSLALQQGYQTSGQIFSQDAARQQAQQQMQAQTALGAGNLANSGAQTWGAIGNQNAQYMGALGQMYQQQLGTDAAALAGVGAQQQGLQQQQIGVDYNDFLTQRDWDMNRLNWMSNLIRGQAMPTTTTSAGNAPLTGAQYPASPLNMLQGIYGSSQIGR